MSRYLFLCDDVGAIVEVPSNFTSEEWGECQTAFARAAGKRNPERAHVACPTLWEDQKYHGVYYSWELAGPHGGSYQLYHLPDTPAAAVAECKRTVKNRFDVVHLSVYRVNRLIDFTVSRSNQNHVENHA
jgi:hypothetical protein